MTISNINIYNFYDAILNIRLSFKSTDKSDSKQIDLDTDNQGNYYSYNHCIIGKEDEKLIRKLMNSKMNGERKFLRQILVSMNIKAPIKFWCQCDTYKIATVRNSESTMHCITKGDIKQEDFERDINTEHLEYLNNLIKEYNKAKNETGEYYQARKGMFKLNREEFLKDTFELIDANLPAGYLLESHYTCNYANLRDMYRERKHHKMYYWKEFCAYIEKLPYFELLIG